MKLLRTRPKPLTKRQRGVVLALVSSAVVLLMHWMGLLEYVELKTLDLRFRLRGPIESNPNIAMVDIADDAIAEFGRFPFGREFHGLFIDAATALGASEIIFDIYFTRRGDPEADEFLGQMAEEAQNTFFGLKFYPHKIENLEETDSTELSLLNTFSIPQHTSDRKQVHRAQGMLDPPLDVVAHGARGMGFINTLHDMDGVSRRSPAVLQYNNRYFLQLCLPALAHRYGVNCEDIMFVPGKALVFPNVREGEETKDLVIPLDKDNNFLINWVGKWTDLKHYSFRDILVSYKLVSEGAEPVLPLEELQELENKMLVVGYVGRGSHDYYPTPFENEFFLPGLHYNLLNTILDRRFIHRPPAWLHVLLVVALSLMLSYLIYYTPPSYRHVSPVLYILLVLAGSFFAFARFDIWLPTVGPMLALGLCFGSNMFDRYLDELKSKKRVKVAFQKYVTKDVMDQLLVNPDRLKPGGEAKLLTVFFSDIRGFTSMSEKHTPVEIVDRLNEYLGIMTRIILSFNGTIDKFVGDEIMVYFGAPLYPEEHAKRAVHAAVTMKRKMAELEEKWKAEGKVIIQIGIGINTGEVVMGNIGSEDYMDFTLIGDNVNLGARLCSKAKPSEILISESTYRDVSAHVEVVGAEEIMVKGKEKPVRVYSIMDYIEDPEKDRRRHRRVEVEIRILMKMKASEDPFEEVVVNISGGGFRMNGQVRIEPDTVVITEIPLPNGIRLRNVEARILSTDSIDSGQWESRAEFTSIAPHARDELVKLVYLGA